MSAAASAQTETILHSFADGPGGADPSSALIFDPAGNLYGVTHDGGHIGGRDCGGCGVVFELSPTVSGGWKETVLAAFTWFNGAYPQAGLIRDAAGNFYGTASDGGYLCSCGVVFELSPTSTGAWKLSVLHSFYQGSDGFSPSSPLTLDSAGNLYGTASYGGSTSAECSYGCGVVFMLSPSSGGKWKEKVLYTFAGDDGANPLRILMGHGRKRLCTRSRVRRVSFRLAWPWITMEIFTAPPLKGVGITEARFSS